MKIFANHAGYHRRKLNPKLVSRILDDLAGEPREPLKLDMEGFDSLIRSQVDMAQSPIRLIGAEPAAVQFDHLTLTTGHNRVSPVAEADPDLTSFLLPYMEQAVNGEFAAVPVDVKPDGWAIRGAVFGDSLVLTIYGPCMDMGREGDGQGERLPIITMVASPGGEDGRVLWKMLHEGHHHLATWGKEAPKGAWCGARLEIPGSMVYEAALPWIAEFERHVTWSWLSAQVIVDSSGEGATPEPERDEDRTLSDLIDELRGEIAAGMGIPPSAVDSILGIGLPDVQAERALTLLYGLRAALGSVAATAKKRASSKP